MSNPCLPQSGSSGDDDRPAPAADGGYLPGIHRVRADRLPLGGYSLGSLAVDPVSPYVDQDEWQRLQLDALVCRCDDLQAQAAAVESSRSVWRTTAVVALIVATVLGVIAVWLAFADRPDSVEVGPRSAPATALINGATPVTAVAAAVTAPV
ncbi:hypothetical protein [Gordonia sihwensis]|uniref:hypothetical protein n=1 Tax=Gordonia sihwensis TaxID=173559 RepID=UPI0005EE5FD8|nr:hypothetical protein [Gordonia sihwensis]KJR10522.1 hypothetical protein UG54_00560 [Gordonia sihwensis]